MNLVTGDTIKVGVAKDRGFTAEIAGSWYDEKGHHHLELNFTETWGYQSKPKSVRRGKDLYPIVDKHLLGADHAEAAERKLEQKLNNDALSPRYAHVKEDAARQKELLTAYRRGYLESKLEYSAHLETFGGEGVVTDSAFVVRFSHTRRTEAYSTQRDAVLAAMRNLQKEYCYCCTIVFLQKKIEKGEFMGTEYLEVHDIEVGEPLIITN